MSKKLVAYFSASGVTAKVAQTMAEAIGVDIFEIAPKRFRIRRLISIGWTRTPAVSLR